MRVNCHAHVFNARSVFTAETLDILLRRITEMEIPDLIKNELAKQIASLFKKAGSYVDEEALFRSVVKKVSASGEFKKLLKGISLGEMLQVEGGGALEDYAVEGLVTLLSRVGETLDKGKNDAAAADIMDSIAFLRIALLPDIRHVTDALMEQLTRDDGVVALTMDITGDGANGKLLEQQLADTAAQILAWPGRFFPFVAVNPRRPEHFSIMETALAGRGFVGVKLYPSLGYRVDSAELFRVYAHCEERGVPILMHCSRGGFYHDEPARDNSDPALWLPILEKHPRLKICFGHFGGAENLAGPAPPSRWTATILSLMEKYGQVYADLAFHSEPMKGGETEKNYFTNLTALLQDARYRSRILFGTDFFLSRQRLTEKNYWSYFRGFLSEEDFSQICEANPAGYLGLPGNAGGMGQAIENYVRLIYRQRDSLLSEAPDWLKRSIKDLYGASATLPKPSLGPKWSWNNKVHAYLYLFLVEGQLSEVQKKRGFEPAGLFKLRDLAYWNKGFEAREIWDLKVRAIAQNLDSFIRHNGAKYEKNQSPDKAQTALEKLFNDGSRYIHEVGDAIDGIYLF